MDSLTLISSVYGVVVSTTVAIVQIINHVTDTGRIEITAWIGRIAGDPQERDQIVTTITNVGRRPVMVMGYGGKSRKEGGAQESWLFVWRTLPKMLSEGEYTVELSHETNVVEDLTDLLAWDSTGKYWHLSGRRLKKLKKDWKEKFGGHL